MKAFFWPLLMLAAGMFSAAWAPIGPSCLPNAHPDTWEQEMLSAVNALRAQGVSCDPFYEPQAPLQPLKLNRICTQAAQQHAEWMYRNQELSHRDHNGHGVGYRLTQLGYKWSAAAENAAAGQTSVREVVNSWRNSGGHCRNILSTKYQHVGFGRKGDYWVQVFAR